MTNKRDQTERRQKLEQAKRKLEERPLPQPENEAGENSPAEAESREAARRALVEQKIQEAMAGGAFDNLPGRGKPLSLRQNPYMEPGQDLAFGLLQQNGFAPEWIERDQVIRRDLEQARQGLRRAWRQFQADPSRAASWEAAVARFETQLARLNRQIDDLNLIVPAVSCQRARLRLERELRRVQQEET